MKRALAFSVLGVWAACGDNEHPPRVVMDVSDRAPRYGRAPFPTDALREGPLLGRIEGLEAMAQENADGLADHLATLDGFGVRPTVEFFIQGPIDPDTVPATTRALTDALFVLDVDPDTGESGAAIPFEWRYDALRGVISGVPAIGTQLREGTRYAAVLTTDVKGPDGLAVYASYELGLVGAEPPERWRTTSAAYNELRALPGLEERIAGLAVFTTQYATDALVKARNVIANVAELPAPTIAFDDAAIIFDTPGELDALLGSPDRFTSGPRASEERWGNTAPGGVAHDHVAVIATGTTTIGRFVREDSGTDGPEDETFLIGPAGVPRLQEEVSIPITVVLPEGPMPADGFPVVVYGHDVGASRHEVLKLAEPLAVRGYALVAIDLWGHGSRNDPTDTGNNLAGRPTSFNGDASLRDGFAEASNEAYIEFFHRLRNVSAIRDSIRQSTLDLARVATLIRANPLLSALSAPYGNVTPRFDPSKVAYLGEGFGSLIGTNLAAIEPSIGLYILASPGGGLFDWIMPNSPRIGGFALPVVESQYRTTGTIDRFHPLIGMLQALFDPADALTSSRRILRDRLMVENQFLGLRHVVALQAMTDERMPAQATEALARAIGLHVLQPNLTVPSGLLQVGSPGGGNVNAQTAVLAQYSPATYNLISGDLGVLLYEPGYPADGEERFPSLVNGITIADPLYAVHDQIAELLATYFAGEVPRVRSTQTPVADFDGDGTPDTSDPAPTDPMR